MPEKKKIKVVGDMYSAWDAQGIISRTLREVYGDCTYLSEVVDINGTYFERRSKIRSITVNLLGGNYRREYVESVKQGLKNKDIIFYIRKADIKAIYNDFVPDYQIP